MATLARGRDGRESVHGAECKHVVGASGLILELSKVTRTKASRPRLVGAVHRARDFRS